MVSLHVSPGELAQRRAVQVGLPKAVLQQLCHKSKPAWPAPRFNKLSRTGEPPRYACTIVFPKARTKASKKNGQQPPSGTRTWQLQESEDVWDSIQDAQNAAALKALFELMPALTDEYQLKPPFRYPSCLPFFMSPLLCQV